MHGIIFAELQKYVEMRGGESAWTALLAEAGLHGRAYLTTHNSPDHEFQALVATAARIAGTSPAVLLEDFGRFVTPDLAKMYGQSIPPNWRTLDLLEHTEAAIHKIVRRTNSDANPPRLVVARAAADRVVITYTSPRKLCAFAKGIVQGVAALYGERVRVSESTCMLKGEACCTITVTSEASPSDPSAA